MSEHRCMSSQGGCACCWTSFSFSKRKLGPMQWKVEAEQVKVNHRPYSFEDGLGMYPANAFGSRVRSE